MTATVAVFGIRGAAESLARTNRKIEEWAVKGEASGFVFQGVSWWIGDWWIVGEERFGMNKAATEDPEWQGPPYEVCRAAARVCRAFSPQRRRPSLSFEHHAEVAHLPAGQADRLLDWCEGASDRTQTELRPMKNSAGWARIALERALGRVRTLGAGGGRGASSDGAVVRHQTL